MIDMRIQEFYSGLNGTRFLVSFISAVGDSIPQDSQIPISNFKLIYLDVVSNGHLDGVKEIVIKPRKLARVLDDISKNIEPEDVMVVLVDCTFVSESRLAEICQEICLGSSRDVEETKSTFFDVSV